MKDVKLRKLEEKDIPFMLEWMHDYDVYKYFRRDYNNLKEEDVKEYIENSFNENIKEFAFTDENDEYMGTIGLKNISLENRNGEYHIVTRKKYQGKGYAYAASIKLLDYAFNELKLHKVYLNVYSDNQRAISFYKKLGFQFEGTSKDQLFVRGEYRDLNWYGLIKEEDDES